MLDSDDPARPGRPAKTGSVSRSCARIAPGRPIEPEKFDRRRRLPVVSMETVVATMVCSKHNALIQLFL
jgi:hypothetical protein